ncbi:MAG: hypothetical protein ACOCWA_01840 [Bacteroidota bacterium]
MKKTLIALFLIIHPFLTLHSQDTDLRETFLAAESYFLFEEFNEALPLYLKIYRNNPENDNVNFKIGVCYLNDPYQKNKAIYYLEKAVENINPKYRENNFKEKAAPLDALFYLGNAYQINNQLEKAKEYYRLFLTRIDPDIYDVELVRDQIKACDAAQKLMKKPIDFDVQNLGRKINTRFADENPVISGDESRLAFVSQLQFYDAVFYTEKLNGEWTAPRNIVPELGVDGDVYPTSLSYNGTEMFIYRNDNFIGNLYSSKLVNGKWTNLKKLNDNINTRFWESHASVSKDGKTLYFSSNRKGGYGGLDIYRSERQENGEWGPAINLGPKVNSKYNDDTPFVTETGNKLFFSSYGHYNMGGYDIFMSLKDEEGQWSEPVNIGYPINTTDDNQFFVPIKDGEIAYHSKFNPTDGFGKHDIFRYEIYSPDNPRMFAIEGWLDLLGVEETPENIDILVVEQSSDDTLNMLNPDQDLTFNFEVPAGSYEVIFNSERFEQEILKLDVNTESPISGLVLDMPVTLDLLKPAISSEELEKMLDIREDSIIYVKEGEKAKIRYNVEKGSKVVIDVINDDELVLTDSLVADKKRQRYEFDPVPGENEFRITVSDENDNRISKEIKVIDMEVVKKEIDKPYQEEITRADTVQEMEPGKAITEAPAEDQDNLKELLEALSSNASEELHQYLENLDPETEGINSDEDLIDHLYKVAKDENFTSADVSSALEQTGRLNELDIFIHELASLSAPGLRNYLLDINPVDLNLHSIEELINHLFDAAENEDYTRKDVADALAKYYGLKNMAALIDELLSLSDGSLHDYLSELTPEEEGIFTLSDLYQHLLKAADDHDFSKDDVVELFEDYFASYGQDPLFILEKLINAAEGEILSFLKNIREDEIQGMNRKSFYDYLIRKAEKEDINIIDLLATALDAEEVNPENLKLYLKEYGQKGIRKAPDQLPRDIMTSGEIFKHIAKLSETDHSVDRDELIGLIKEYLQNKEVYELYYDLLRHSEEDLKRFLQTLDIRKSDFNNRTDLIDFLLEKAKENGFTPEDVYNVLENNYKKVSLSNLIHNLEHHAEKGLKEALRDLDPARENIRDLGDLLNYLFNNKEKYGYSGQDVYHLIEKNLALEIMPEAHHAKDDDRKELKEKFNRGAVWTAGILILEGLLILILILIARKKKKKKEEEVKS